VKTLKDLKYREQDINKCGNCVHFIESEMQCHTCRLCVDLSLDRWDRINEELISATGICDEYKRK